MTKIALPPKLRPVFAGKSRYRVAHGGRGSGKSYSFALMTAVRGYQEPMKILCCREQQNSIKDSVFDQVKVAIQDHPFLEDHYDIGESYIRGKNGTEYIFRGLKRNVNEVKSMTGVKICWVEEAETVSEESWRLLGPTIRLDDSEIWVTYNPANETSPTSLRFYHDPPDNAKVVQLNWSDNPRFPKVLESERLNDKERNSLFYDHIWEGKFLDASGGLWFPDWIKWVKYEDIPKDGEDGRFWDLAYSEEETADRTAGIITRRSKDGRIFQWGHYVARHQWPTMKQKIIELANKDGVRRIGVDSTMSQVGYLNDLQTTRELSMFRIDGKRHSTNKIQNAMAYISRCEAGIVHWVDTPMAREFAKEMGMFSDTCEHDDCMDAAANGYEMVAGSPVATSTPAF
jgi:predicted phage terminase large subunit-like protein